MSPDRGLVSEVVVVPDDEVDVPVPCASRAQVIPIPVTGETHPELEVLMVEEVFCAVDPE